MASEIDTPARQLEGAELDEEASRPKALLPRMKRLPAKRVVHLPPPSEGAPDPLPFALSFEPGHPLPPGASTPELAAFEITGGGSDLLYRYSSLSSNTRVPCCLYKALTGDMAPTPLH